MGLDESNSVSVEFDNSDEVDDSEEDNNPGEDEPIWQDINSDVAKSIANSIAQNKDNEAE